MVNLFLCFSLRNTREFSIENSFQHVFLFDYNGGMSQIF